MSASRRRVPDDAWLELWRVDLAAEGTDADVGLLSAAERNRAERFVVPAPRRQFVRTRAALRRILARRLGCAPGAVKLVTGEHGKPSLPGGTLSFNVSHSADIALVVVGAACWGGRLGIDVERAAPERRLERLARRFFAEDEAAFFLAAPPGRQTDIFYRLWTLKEAYLKSWGTGLTFSSRRFSVALAEAGRSEGGPPGQPAGPRLLRTEMPGDRPQAWSFVELDVGAHYRAALCLPSLRGTLDSRPEPYLDEEATRLRDATDLAPPDQR
ncbi:MAG: 4-phosphopantetheinyl transferase [Acidobacteria bacterium]|nr:MAG: 4-phosphopantetheinyl transferase [Acidobacteriota bacterium]REK00137.1 MAG: 4-phosphopantetheinyl transferase [Acidobacteriota bacterium]